MKQKLVLILGIAVMIALTTYFVFQQNTLFAATSVMGMFVLTNALRVVAFRERGMEREAQWMKIVAIISAVVFLALLMMSVYL